MPLKFWDEAFLTATYLINHTPTRVLDFSSPFTRLFKEKPNYSFPRVFGCVCWPNLRPYNKHKLQIRSKQCAFLGYSSMHKGYKCLDIYTGRVYISRDVVFDEGVFPFLQLHPNAGARLHSEILLLPPHLTNHAGDMTNSITDLSNASPELLELCSDSDPDDQTQIMQPVVFPFLASSQDSPSSLVHPNTPGTASGADTLTQQHSTIEVDSIPSAAPMAAIDSSSVSPSATSAPLLPAAVSPLAPCTPAVPTAPVQQLEPVPVGSSVPEASVPIRRLPLLRQDCHALLMDLFHRHYTDQGHGFKQYTEA